MRITVFGGCRFIGYDVALSLVEEGHEVTIFDDAPCPKANNNVRKVEASPREADLVEKWVKWSEIIYNFYEYDGVNEARLNPRKAIENNINTAYNILEAISKSKTRRIIHISTAAVYGEQENQPIIESTVKKPINWYGATKSAAEEIVAGFSKEREVEAVILRLFNVYGPGEWNRNNPGVVNRFITSILRGSYIRLEGGGYQVRDFIHVVDAVRASLIALQLPPGIYNIGSGRGTSIVELASMVMDIYGKPVEVVMADKRPGDISKSIASINKIKNISGWKPLIPLHHGLTRLYKYYRRKIL